MLISSKFPMGYYVFTAITTKMSWVSSNLKETDFFYGVLEMTLTQLLYRNTSTWVSVSQFNHSVVSNSSWPHESQHARPPCPSPTPRVYSNPCPSSQWCHPTISSSVVPFSSCPQSLPASGSFPMSQLFAWGGQSTGAVSLNTKSLLRMGTVFYWFIILDIQ